MLFLHDLTRRGEPAYEAADAAIAAALQGEVLHVFNKADAPRLVQPPARPPCPAWRCRPAPAPASTRCARPCCSAPAGRRSPTACSSPAPATCRRCSAHGPTWRKRKPTPRSHDAALDLLAEELRLAHNTLGEITGAFGSEDLLGEIFSRFCIGK